jgi:dissimilatory sulfite reductase related protein
MDIPTTDLNGLTVDVTDDGFFVHPEQWTRDMAEEIAGREGVGSLTDAHWRVIEFVRSRFLDGIRPPSTRLVSKHCGMSVRTLYDAFPQRPVKTAAKIAGVPEPQFYLGGCLANWGPWSGPS